MSVNFTAASDVSEFFYDLEAPPIPPQQYFSQSPIHYQTHESMGLPIDMGNHGGYDYQPIQLAMPDQHVPIPVQLGANWGQYEPVSEAEMMPQSNAHAVTLIPLSQETVSFLKNPRLQTDGKKGSPKIEKRASAKLPYARTTRARSAQILNKHKIHLKLIETIRKEVDPDSVDLVFDRIMDVVRGEIAELKLNVNQNKCF